MVVRLSVRSVMGQAGRRIASADSFSASVNRCSGGAAAGGSSTGIAYLVRSVLAGRRRRERHCENPSCVPLDRVALTARHSPRGTRLAALDATLNDGVPRLFHNGL